jgi:hypothetical protein
LIYPEPEISPIGCYLREFFFEILDAYRPSDFSPKMAYGRSCLGLMLKVAAKSIGTPIG